MKFFIVTSITVFAFSVIMVTKAFAARGCPEGWVPYADSCYLGLDGSMKGNWSIAVKKCDQNNASIMVPSSDGENEFIFTSFQHHEDLYGVWINCNDIEVEGEWNCYEDGKYPTEYRKWEPNQPDDNEKPGDQDYGFMLTKDYKNNPDILGYWGDTWGNENQMFVICERLRQARCVQSTTYCLTADESTGRFVSRCLFSHTLDRYPTTTVPACGQRCVEREDCLSFNIKSSSTSRVCELNNATRSQVLKEYFQESKGCNYFDFECVE